MNLRPLGRSSLSVAPLAFGGNVFGWSADEARSFALLDAFTEAGFSLVDTADAYSAWAPGNQGGESERIIGRWLAQGGGRRERTVIATKVGKWAPRRGLAPANIQAAAVLSSLLVYAAVYLFIFGFGIWYLRKLLAVGPVKQPPKHVEGGEKTPARPLSLPDEPVEGG